MHIGMIYGEPRPFPPDIRVEKEISALRGADHRITVLTQRIPTTAPLQETLASQAATVVRVSLQETRSRGRRWFDLVRMMETLWVKPLAEFIQTEDPAVLHVHDFSLVPTVLRVAEPYGIPVVADLHENMPAAHRIYRTALPLSQRLLSSVLFNYHLMCWHEARALKRCAKVIVVVPEAAERLYEYKIPPEKIVVVSNTEDETTFRFHPKDTDSTILEQYRPYWIASYIGGIGPHRGLDTALRAVPLVLAEIPNFRLLIVGANEHQRMQIQSEVARLQIESHVEVISWQPFDKVNSFVMASDVCLVPHNDSEHTHTTVPHKLFQYMICGKPVLVSSCRPLARIVGETQAGLVFEANDSESLAARLIWMHKHPKLCEEMGTNGQKAALGPYAWRHDAERLVQMYHSLDNLSLS